MDLFLRASIALLGFLTPLVSATAPTVPAAEQTAEPAPAEPAPAEPAPADPAPASQTDTTQPVPAEAPAPDPSVTDSSAAEATATDPSVTDTSVGDASDGDVASTTTTVQPDSSEPQPAPGEGGAAPTAPCPTTPGTPDAPASTPTDQATDTTVQPPADQTTVPGDSLPAQTVPAACDPTAAPADDTTTVPSDPPATDQPATTETTVDPLADPLVDEAPPEDAPETDETVPAPGGAYEGQNSFQPAEVLWSSVKAAEAKVAETRRIQEERIEAVRQIRREHKELRVAQRALGEEARRAAAEIGDAQTLLTERAVAAFINDDALSNAVIGSFDAADHDKILELRVRRRLLDAVLDQDENAIEDYLTLRAEIDDDVLGGLDTLRVIDRALRHSTNEAEQAADDVVQAENELDAFAAGSAIYIEDVVFPVGDGYGLPLIDSYGFPRMPGTPDEHWHEGIDIFAPSGTPLVATERGVVTRVGSGRLGGLTVWLRGESGTDWYYAHLLSHAPGLVEGAVVDGGDLLGYVGNTGNARTTPPHLHMQVHPGGGDPVNPYPLLKVISDRDLARSSD